MCSHLFRAPNTQHEPAAVLSAQGRTVCGQGPDGPQPSARLGFLPDGRTVRTCAGAAEDRRRRLDLLSGGTPSGRRDPRSCLGSGRPT
jgi:hypothetical protein